MVAGVGSLPKLLWLGQYRLGAIVIHSARPVSMGVHFNVKNERMQFKIERVLLCQKLKR